MLCCSERGQKVLRPSRGCPENTRQRPRGARENEHVTSGIEVGNLSIGLKDDDVVVQSLFPSLGVEMQRNGRRTVYPKFKGRLQAQVPHIIKS